MPSLRFSPALVTPEHLEFREAVRRFVDRELEPHAAPPIPALGSPELVAAVCMAKYTATRAMQGMLRCNRRAARGYG